MATPTRPAPPTPLGPTEPPAGPHPPGRGWWLILLVSLALIGLVALGIGVVRSDSDPDPAEDASDSTLTEPTQPTTAATTPTTIDPEQVLRTELEAAYNAAEPQAFFEAAGIPDPDHPALAATHTQPMLDVRRALMIALLGDGRIMRLPANSQYRNAFESIEFPPEPERTVAIVTVCTVDDGEVVDVATGQVIAGGAGTVQWRAAMRLENGVWQLAERQELGRWPGVAGCAA
ncbi:MAG: hypothetical protein ACRD0A_04475 [Acidimicrobiales bacterium]